MSNITNDNQSLTVYSNKSERELLIENVKNWTVLDEKLRIINECKTALGSDGGFIQFQYSLNAKDLLYKKFNSVDITFTPLNLPPAFVYHCSF